eukprot:3347509-Pleurochrysis_carterae.AAC.1
MDICDCKERRLKRRVRCKMSKLLSATASARKDSTFDVRGAVCHQIHGSSSQIAEQPAEL